MRIKDGVNSGQHEEFVPKIPAQHVETVHGTGCRLNDETQGYGLTCQPFILNVHQMACHIGHVLVADDNNLRGMVCQEDAQQTVDETLTAHLHQWFRGFHTLRTQA